MASGVDCGRHRIGKPHVPTLVARLVLALALLILGCAGNPTDIGGSLTAVAPGVFTDGRGDAPDGVLPGLGGHERVAAEHRIRPRPTQLHVDVLRYARSGEVPGGG